jgi:hypothetical protein
MAREKNFKKPPVPNVGNVGNVGNEPNVPNVGNVQNVGNVLQCGLAKGSFGEQMGNKSVSAGLMGSRVYGQ